MEQRDGVAKLRDEIIGEARRRAQAEVRNAEAEVAQQVEHAEEEARAERDRLLHEADREADLIRRRARSRAEVEANRALMDAREQLIAGVLQQVRAGLSEAGAPQARLDTLKALAEEAARQIGAEDLVVTVSPEDAKLVTMEQLRDVERRLAAGGGRAAFQRIEVSPDISGGVVVSGNGGRVVVDNSLGARLKRSGSELRALIWNVLSAGSAGAFE